MTRKQLATGLGWAGLITATELLARRTLHRRAHAWLLSYSWLAAAATLGTLNPPPRPSPARGEGESAATGFRFSRLSLVGLALAAVGYPLGRRLLRDPSTGPPRDPLLLELGAIEMVAAVEELAWGGIVEPALGGPTTAALFALKHVAIDGRWRRAPGLFTFWLGLSLQRQRWPAAALVSHLVLNTVGVTQGHLTKQDRF
ncbi:MAG: hypothetical protein M3Z11_10790 [Candidatus Dormibacteraeota bacterium]|nr:hypothetical protein [Candidatus Dormibacteraeota bacterium]